MLAVRDNQMTVATRFRGAVRDMIESMAVKSGGVVRTPRRIRV
jgi:hypothetical protein